MNRDEQKILQVLDIILNQDSIKVAIDSLLPRVEQKLTQNSDTSLAWEVYH